LRVLFAGESALLGLSAKVVTVREVSSIPVAQALQRHSGGWKAPMSKETPPSPRSGKEPEPRERGTDEH